MSNRNGNGAIISIPRLLTLMEADTRQYAIAQLEMIEEMRRMLIGGPPQRPRLTLVGGRVVQPRVDEHGLPTGGPKAEAAKKKWLDGRGVPARKKKPRSDIAVLSTLPEIFTTEELPRGLNQALFIARATRFKLVKRTAKGDFKKTARANARIEEAKSA